MLLWELTCCLIGMLCKFSLCCTYMPTSMLDTESFGSLLPREFAQSEHVQKAMLQDVHQKQCQMLVRLATDDEQITCQFWLWSGFGDLDQPDSIGNESVCSAKIVETDGASLSGGMRRGLSSTEINIFE